MLYWATDMALPKAYEAGKYENKIYDLWEKSGVFIADPKSHKKHFSMAMPPPNETGTLHVGHALFLTLQDILARWQRQKGKDVLWLPGTDHAALPVNALMEKSLAEQGTDKHKLGREEFLRLTKEFVGNSRSTINSQVRAMGASVDWSRGRYTLDEALNRCVNEVFVRMYNDGLIYRGHRIVNWDPKSETTVSDDEVVYKEEKAAFYVLQYGPFQIGTARPETKFGDKYVVMHPDDKRYKQYKSGQTIEVEWLNGPVTATIIKDGAVDPKFGTGVMTITPWHDRTDFEIAERHGLDKEQIIGFDGRLLPIAKEFANQTIDEARPKIVQKLKDKNLLVREEKYTHNVALNDRGKGVIEPQIKLQWFVDVNRPAVDWKGQKRSFKEVMRAVIEDGDIKIVPARFEKVYYHWIDNLRDWNISRQIWWGHRVPVWTKGDETYAGIEPPKGKGWQQDPDTLDTWFSSALWTWSTLIDQGLAKDFSLSLEDLLKQSQDYQTYHPTDVMETGWDILFFWVARMILATTYATGQVPFKTVYLHGLVRTEAGKKMSKSDPDTIIDPMEVIPEFGTDALRLALVSGVSAGTDQRLGKSKIVAGRNFANKLWNIARYIDDLPQNNKGEAKPKSLADHWILDKSSIFLQQLDRALTGFKFSEAYELLYHFVWDDLADWYIEASKVEPNQKLLQRVLEDTLKTAHPFMPFITETIWQNLGHKSLLAAELGPEPLKADKAQSRKFEELKKLVSDARAVATHVGVNKPLLLYQDSELIEQNKTLIERLARLGGLEKVEQGTGVRLTGAKVHAWLDIDHQTARTYLAKLEKRAGEAESAIKTLEGRLANKAYMQRAPKKLVADSRTQLAQEKATLETIQTEIKNFQKSLG